MPGRERETVGYLVDEGKIFGPWQPVNPTVGKEYDRKYLVFSYVIILASSSNFQ